MRKEMEDEEDDGRWMRGGTEWKKKRGIEKGNAKGRAKGGENKEGKRE